MDDKPKSHTPTPTFSIPSSPRQGSAIMGPTGSSTPRIPVRATESSAALLKFLHNDPSAHHVTLSPSTSRTPSQMPPTPDVPSASPIPHSPAPPVAPRRPLLSSNSSSFSRDTPAGPSKPALSRGPSLRRGTRPKTAPGSRPDAKREASSGTVTSDVDYTDEIMDLPTEDQDSCTVAIDDLTYAADMMSMSGGASPQVGKGLVIGRAGSSSLPPPPVVPQSTTDKLNWRTFGNSYASGRFDPNRIPSAPKSSDSGGQIPSAHSSPGTQAAKLDRIGNETATDSSGSIRTAGSKNSDSSSTTLTSASSASSFDSRQPVVSRSGSMAAAIAARKRNFELNDVPPHPSVQPMDQLEIPSYSYAAATVRMAASGYRSSDFAPLNMPSPERELMDPMSSVISTTSATTASSDPGPSKHPISRSMSSVETATKRDMISAALPNPNLQTIQASPVTTPDEMGPMMSARPKARVSATSFPARQGGIVHGGRIPAASAPLERAVEAESTSDYFGSVASHPHLDRKQSEVSQSSSSQTVTAAADQSPRSTSKPASPLQLPAIVQPSEVGPLFEKLGWLPAPVPPDELARRKALYRFNILHTAPDVNFDRIAHMAKLVFSSKIVLIALIDSDTQWHKSESGLGASETSRISSFCSHAVLVNNDEPFIVLDTTQDWRFASNPQVIGAPHVRFYAGAPLRTSDGHNLGSLCIIDDKPRSDFPPRSRLILKEFAAVAMREMELWRDKIQLRTRDKIQTSMEKFTRECLEMDVKVNASKAEVVAKMDQVYARAARLVSTTLDLDGCVILDIGQFEMVETEGAGGGRIYRANPYGDESSSIDPVIERSDGFGPVGALPVLASIPSSVPTRPLTAVEHEKLSEFLCDNRDGRIFENVAPSWIRYMFPSALKYGMVVPIFGVDQQPFALICAYTCDKAKQFLEGYELQFLRAIGVVILSAVLKRRMVQADKAKSILISSVSHELRTPLHGILAAAELLADTDLDSNQLAFLKTVQTCGNSLIETVNHVLDFTKLSGSAKESSGTNAIKLARVNLASLVESTVEGCWIGQRARLFHGDSGIGSFYAPPPSSLIPKDQRKLMGEKLNHVETVIDIAQREKGWNVRCEKGGLRRVLMNLVGNSLKFTTDGFVQVTLRELPQEPGSKTIQVEMAVVDTGKGIGKEFLKDQLFHPFSQENPLQTGTGLGLAIVNSIVRSENVNGKVDVWSAEGMGTEIRVSFEVELVDDDDDASSSSSVTSVSSHFGFGHSVSFVGFAPEHRGLTLELEVLSSYARGWQFDVQDTGHVIVINEDEDLIQTKKHLGRPILFLLATRKVDVYSIRDEINKSGGYCQILYKPIGPAGLQKALREAVEWMDPKTGSDRDLSELDVNRPPISRGSSEASAESGSTISEMVSHQSSDKSDRRLPLTRRRSEEDKRFGVPSRPAMAPRGMTYHAPAPPRRIASSTSADGSSPGSPTSTYSTISLPDGGVMLKAAALPESYQSSKTPRVMVVEDNPINRQVLGAFLKKKGFEYQEAHDGQQGVELFASTPNNHWDCILMDISMPNMNGYEATAAIRRVESARRSALTEPVSSTNTTSIPLPHIIKNRVKIFALTGLATADDKRRAFGSGVDGYLVKPVSFKTISQVFKKMGF